MNLLLSFYTQQLIKDVTIILPPKIGFCQICLIKLHVSTAQAGLVHAYVTCSFLREKRKLRAGVAGSRQSN